MYLRQILRTHLVGTRVAHLSRLHRVCRAEVAPLQINSVVLILVTLNILFSLSAAEHIHDCPTSPGGSCGTPAASHHPEVWSHMCVCNMFVF